MKHLYLAEWNSNGTNDLLICEGCQIIAVIESATFGYRVEPENLDRITVVDDFGLLSIRREEMSPSFTLVSPVSLETVVNRRACNPFDPNGTLVLQQLQDLGFDVEAVLA